MNSRRKFLKTCCLGTCGAAIHRAIYPHDKMLAYAFPSGITAVPGSNRVLLVVNLAGGCSYNAVPPYNGQYYDLNPTLGRKPDGPGAVNLTPEQGLHPSLKDLKPLWDEGTLGVVNLVTYPNYTRAHDFDTDNWFLGLGTPPRASQIQTGWAARLTCQMGLTFGGVSLSGSNLLIQGDCSPPRSVTGLVAGGSYSPGPLGIYWNEAHRELAIQAGANPPSKAARFMQEQLRELSELSSTLNGPLSFSIAERYGITFPTTGIGSMFGNVAKLLVTPELGTRFIFCEQGGYDTHQNEATRQAQNLTELNDALAALVRFAKDPRVNRWQDLVIVTMSEFGRTWENASLGTDHGHSGFQLVIGGGIRGGRLVTPAPTASDCAANPSFLTVSHVDNRQVFKESVQAMGFDAEMVFPGTGSFSSLNLFR